MIRFKCEKCGCRDYSDVEGFGQDEKGEYTDYVCAECGHVTTLYDEEFEKKKVKIQEKLLV
ncbi:MAG: hypothetical protein ABRQ25_07050 [Clostridiaceae bacterium]